MWFRILCDCIQWLNMHIAFAASYPIFVDFQKNFAGKIIDPTYLIKLEIIGKGENSHSVIRVACILKIFI